MRITGKRWRELGARKGTGRIFRVLIILGISGAFSVVPLFLLYDNFQSSAGFQPLDNETNLQSPAVANYYGNPVEVYSAAPSALCVTFGFLTLDPGTSYANFSILVGVTKYGKAEFTRKHLGPDNTVLLVISSKVGLSTITIPIQVSTLADGSISSCGGSAKIDLAGLLPAAGFRANQNIFVLGQPRSFPDDWYELKDTIAAYTASCATVQNQFSCRPYLENRVSSSVIMMTRDEDFLTSVRIDPPAAPPSMPSPFEFVIHRPLSTIIYTYWVAAMPFLLLASVILFYTFGKGKAEKKAPAFYEVAFGVAATVVAILPLRIVLVPSSLPSLTRLDLVFSTGVTLLVGLSVAYISVGAAKRKPDDPDNQPGVTG
jgi:hypothetical protein